MWNLILCIFLVIGSSVGQTLPTIDPEPLRVLAGDLGLIQGAYLQTIDEPTTYVSFHGIPYADPASYTGENRFQPSSIWTGPLPTGFLNLTYFAAINPFIYCPQTSLLAPSRKQSTWDLRKILKAASYNGPKFSEENPENPESKLDPGFMGQEDCLVLNINTPKVPKDDDDADDELLPVMVYIHGGGSDFLWGSLFNGQRFLQKKVVFVTINYRLGALGSLNLGIDSAPGNAAMYDAITSLRWIKQYIRFFGGDPERVTVSGFSAGAMMATNLLLTPMANGLVHRIIGSSGSALNVWGTARHPSLPVHLRLAHHAGCYDEENPIPVEEVALCMRESSAENLIMASDAFEFEQESTATGTGLEAKVVSIQNPNLSIDKILTEHPLTILKEKRQNNIPLLMGAARHDGTYALPAIYENYIKYNDLLNDTMFMKHELVPTFLRAMGIEIDSEAFASSIAKTYLGEMRHTEDIDSKMPGLVDLATVFAFKAGTWSLVEKHSKLNENSFYYNFDHFGLWPMQDIIGDTDVFPGGIGHGDEILYHFQLLPLLEKNDLDVSRRMVNYFVNFMYYGNPNGDVDAEEVWPRYNEDELPYLSIQKEDQVMYNPRENWIGMGQELFKKEVEN